MSFKVYLKWVMEQRGMLSRGQAGELMQAILQGGASEIELAGLLGALAGRGETAEELAGFVDALREAGTGLPLSEAERETLVDTCGTGGDHSGTFNISTAAALVAAAAGAPVAKHGNRAVTSQCGSADVLQALGIAVDLQGETAAEALRRHGFVFLHAPTHHPALCAVMPVRQGLGVRTVFNLLGPLLNPAGARAQVMGVYAAHAVEVVAKAMALLEVRHAFVVHGDAGDGVGMDEISISGKTDIAEVRDGRVRLTTLSPEDAGLRRVPAGLLAGGDAGVNAALLTGIFAGRPGPARDVVILNAAAVLVTAGMAADIAAGVALAAGAIDSSAVAKLVAGLRADRVL